MTTTRNQKRTTALARRLVAAGASIAVAVPMGMALAAPAGAATSAETAAMLQAMVAEEKLAHDVYVSLGDLYDVRTFDNIARAETRHQDAIRVLMNTYGVMDPTVGDAVGEFDDPNVQALYDSLVAQGDDSLAAAAQVGITIEKLDIADLQQALDEDQPADVARVLKSLMSGSENHLAAFTNLANGGATAAADGTGMQNGRQGAGRPGAGRQGAGRQGAGRQGTSTSQGAGAQQGTGARDGSCLTK